MLESSSNRFGLGSSPYAKCSGCGMSEFLASGNHPQDDVNPRTLQGKDVNRRMVFAAFEWHWKMSCQILRGLQYAFQYFT